MKYVYELYDTTLGSTVGHYSSMRSAIKGLGDLLETSKPQYDREMSEDLYGDLFHVHYDIIRIKVIE